MNKLVKGIISLFFPKRCPICGNLEYKDDEPCEKCRKALNQINPSICSVCRKEEGDCDCNEKDYSYSSVVMPFDYSGCVKENILRVKEYNRKNSIDFYANKMIEVILREYSHIKFDYITCVPMNKKKLKKRGYNSPKKLALIISRKLNIEYIDALEKIKDTKSQHDLSSKERRRNLYGAFKVLEDENADIEDAVILLCDDVVTTGSTLNECASMLKLKGAKAVFCVTLASTKLE